MTTQKHRYEKCINTQPPMSHIPHLGRRSPWENMSQRVEKRRKVSHFAVAGGMS